MTHAITGRVARSSLSLLLCLSRAAPILTAEEPRPGCAWSPPREETCPCGMDFNLGCCHQDRAHGCPGPVPFGPITLPAATADAPPPALPPTLLEMIDARLKAPPATDAESLALEGYVRANVLPQLAALQWSHQDVWSNGAPLLLLDWSAAGPGNALRPDGVKRVANAQADHDWAALTSKVALRERDDRLDPSIRDTWETDESLRMPL